MFQIDTSRTFIPPDNLIKIRLNNRLINRLMKAEGKGKKEKCTCSWSIRVGTNLINDLNFISILYNMQSHIFTCQYDISACDVIYRFSSRMNSKTNLTQINCNLVSFGDSQIDETIAKWIELKCVETIAKLRRHNSYLFVPWLMESSMHLYVSADRYEFKTQYLGLLRSFSTLQRK